MKQEAYVKDLDLRIKDKQGKEGWLPMSELMRVIAESLAETVEEIRNDILLLPKGRISRQGNKEKASNH